MAKSKFSDNQLNLLNEFDAQENPKLESAADKAIREIYEKIEAAKEKHKREHEGKLVETSLKKIRSEIKAEQLAVSEEPIPEKKIEAPVAPIENKNNETLDDNYIEPFTPAEEYYGRFQRNIGKKIGNPYNNPKKIKR